MFLLNLPYNSYIKTLEFIYCNPEPPSCLNDDNIVEATIKDFVYDKLNGSSENTQAKLAVSLQEKELKQKYSCYFNELTQSLTDVITCKRYAAKKLLLTLPSNSERIFEIALASLGIMVPVTGIVEKMGCHLPYLLGESFNLIQEVGDAIKEGNNFHEFSSPKEKLLNDIKIETFLDGLATSLTHSFYYELSLLSKDNCLKLAKGHAARILDYLSELASNGNVPNNSEDFINLIINEINPNPQTVLEIQIGQYINNHLSEYHNNKEFFTDLLNTALFNNKNKTIENKIIETIHNVGYQLTWKSNFLSNRQVCIFEEAKFNKIPHVLNHMQINLTPEGNSNLQKSSLKNRSFIPNAYCIYSKENLLKRVVLLMTRWLILVQTQNNSNEKMKRLKEMSVSIINELHNPFLMEKIGELKQEFKEEIKQHKKEMKDEVSALDKKVQILSTEFNEFRKTTTESLSVMNDSLADIKRILESSLRKEAVN